MARRTSGTRCASSVEASRCGELRAQQSTGQINIEISLNDRHTPPTAEGCLSLPGTGAGGLSRRASCALSVRVHREPWLLHSLKSAVPRAGSEAVGADCSSVSETVVRTGVSGLEKDDIPDASKGSHVVIATSSPPIFITVSGLVLAAIAPPSSSPMGSAANDPKKSIDKTLPRT